MKCILDNKASTELKAGIKINYEIQMVLPDNKRESVAEKAIQMYKNHMIAVLMGV